jgi:hypothetical protein
MKLNLYERMLRTQKTVDLWKGRPFKENGTSDCIQLMIAHARHMGKKIKVEKYRDAASRAAALRKLGFKSISEGMDANFTRIDASQVLLGDFVEMPGSNGFSAITVALGNGRVLGFHEDIPHADILQPVLISGVWRVGEMG